MTLLIGGAYQTVCVGFLSIFAPQAVEIGVQRGKIALRAVAEVAPLRVDEAIREQEDVHARLCRRGVEAAALPRGGKVICVEFLKQQLIGARSVRAVDGGEFLPECLLVCARAVVFHHGGGSHLMPMPVML